MKRILVAVDDSERSALVLSTAARLAELSNAKLVLFRAITIPADLRGQVLAESALPLEDVLKRADYEALSQMASTLSDGLVEQLVMEFATPWDGIVRAARACDADMIVIGSHGYGGIDHLLGTTAAKVVNHADRNVLVVRTLL